MTHPYASQAYAAAFTGLAEPVYVEAFGTYMLQRAIPGSQRVDASGAYPVCALADVGDIPTGCAELRAAGLVSVVLVADAFFGPTPEVLARGFSLARPFKTHYVNEPSRPFAYGSHHRYELKQARADCEVREVRLADELEGWKRLYAKLVERHAVTGLQRFSEGYFDRLAKLPALRSHAVFHDSRVVAMHLWIEHDSVLYSHLAASDETGYRLRAGYALNAFALASFRHAKAIDFGAGTVAGALDDAADGLAKFKRGFSNATRTFYLCGAVLDAAAYAALCAGRAPSAYFPAYRG